MAHGYEAPALERAAVLGYPHVGALKNIEALHKTIDKDRKQDGSDGLQPWTEYAGDLPQVWPVRADPVNVVVRHGKGRMTIDKSIRLSSSILSYNDLVDLKEYDPVEMVRVGQLCRAVAILETAGVGVRIWKFDLDAFFRRIGKQRASWWQSGYILPDGYAFDKRVQFGQREAPVLTSRQSNFIVWLIQRETWAFDQRCRPRDPALLAWLLLRGLGVGANGGYACRLTRLGWCMMYVDDAGGCSTDDLLYDSNGAAVCGVWSEAWGCYDQSDANVPGAVHLRRPDVHYAIALAVIVAIGHSAAAGKGEPPSFKMELLGTYIDLLERQRRLPEPKCKAYSSAVQKLLAAPRTAQGATRAPAGAFNSVVHKLLYSSDTVVLGRQHAHHCMAALRAPNRMRNPEVLLHEQQKAELSWWLEQLAHPERHCLPLASRVVFPFADSATTLAAYSDAARELDSPETSGYGGWTVVGDTLYFVAGLFEPWELAAFSINVLELAALNISTFTLLELISRRGRSITHVLDFVDNTAAEYAADRGKPSQATMRALVQARFDALDTLGVYSAVERITSADNEWADALSRGAERIGDVIRFARAVGLRTERLPPLAAWRDLSALPTTW